MFSAEQVNDPASRNETSFAKWFQGLLNPPSKVEMEFRAPRQVLQFVANAHHGIHFIPTTTILATGFRLLTTFCTAGGVCIMSWVNKNNTASAATEI